MPKTLVKFELTDAANIKRTLEFVVEGDDFVKIREDLDFGQSMDFLGMNVHSMLFDRGIPQPEEDG